MLEPASLNLDEVTRVLPWLYSGYSGWGWWRNGQVSVVFGGAGWESYGARLELFATRYALAPMGGLLPLAFSVPVAAERAGDQATNAG